MTYIVVSSNEIVKAEMAVPDCWGWSGPNPMECKKCIKLQAHCLSLPRISIEGKNDWEVWQSVEKGKDFIFIERCCVEFHVLGVSECESSDDDDNPCKCSVAIPIQPTPEGEKVEERLFTLEEALKIFYAGVSRGESYINGWGYENDNGSAEHYFKDKFGIDI